MSFAANATDSFGTQNLLRIQFKHLVQNGIVWQKVRVHVNVSQTEAVRSEAVAAAAEK